ncbi:MAG: aspartate racemase [Desulfotalea sp.]|nr:MAG: aspartate racemase [Desulfotalea sp.]
MKTIGLLGGMSWQSTLDYYRLINQQVARQLGGFHSAKLSMVSLDFAYLEENMAKGNWSACAEILVAGAQKVEDTGAACLLICTNTLHKVAPQVEEAIQIPLLHIADAAGEALIQKKVASVGLLGTRFTMEEEFYRLRLAEKHGLHVLIPDKKDRQIVDRIIFKELCLGRVESNSRKEYVRIIEGLKSQGAEAILLGCTEIAMLVNEEHTDMPLFDTTAIHAARAVKFSLGEDFSPRGA